MLLSLCAIRRVLTSKAMERLLMITAGETATISETDLSPCNPQANSTVLDTFPTESGYVTKGSEATNLPLNDEVDFLGKLCNGQGLGSTDTSMSVCQVTFKESGGRLRCCERSGGREPDFKELSKFITAQSQIENDPVYGRKSESQTKFSVGRNPNKKALEERAGPTIPTLATEVRTQENGGNQRTKKRVTASEQGSNGGNHNQGEHNKVCKGAHAISKCSVFLSKGLGWRRRFARFRSLCYRCLSHTHLQRNCPENTSCTEKDCARPQDHHSLLHISTKNEIEDIEGNPEQSSPVVSNLSVNNATTE